MKKNNLILKKTSKYQFYSLWCDWTWTRTPDLQQMMLAHQPLHHRCGFISSNNKTPKCSLTRKGYSGMPLHAEIFCARLQSF